jgi:glycerophosphoryl diester phosphodiesterase
LSAVAAVSPHPDSVLAGEGRNVALTARRASWSADPPNSLAALESCLRAPVARVAVDLHLVKELGFVAGDGPLPPTAHDRPPRLRDIVALIVAAPGPTTVELRLVDTAPMTWARAEELARLVAPAATRIVVTGRADWNLRRLRAVAPDLRVGFAPGLYLGRDPDRLAPRLVDAIQLVPGAREVHLRLETFEAMLDEGVIDPALIHRLGMRVSVGTLDSTTARWKDRLARAVDAGADMIATATPRALAQR